MATLAVLEGRGAWSAARKSIVKKGPKASFPGARKKAKGLPFQAVAPWGHRLPMFLGADGCMYPVVMGSFWRKVKNIGKGAAKLAVAPVTTAYTVTKSAGKATVAFAKNPSLKTAANIVKNPLVRTVNETKSNVRTAAHTVAETGRIVRDAANVARRVAKRLIKKIAKKTLFKGNGLLGESLSSIPKNAAKGLLIPLATAPVMASTVTAPAAPLVPILVNEVVDELYEVMERNIKKGLSPKQAEAAAKEALDKLEPGEENDPQVSYGGVGMPVLLGGAAAGILLIILMARRRS